MAPRTVRPALRTSSARRAASTGSQPHRGMPTSTSTSTSSSPAAAATAIVSTESTATVTRAPAATTAARRCAARRSTNSLASRRSSPRPVAAMPSTSPTVAQQKAQCPAVASRPASAVHLKALTCGRSAAPGRAADMVAMLASRTPVSASNAGVVRSPALIASRPGSSGASCLGPRQSPLDVDLPRQAQYPLSNDVALHGERPPTEGERRGEHVSVVPDR